MAVQVCRADPRLASVRVVCSELFGTVMSDLGLILVRLAPKRTNLGPFQIRFQYIFAYRITELCAENSRICPIWISLTHFGPKSGHRVPGKGRIHHSPEP